MNEYSCASVISQAESQPGQADNLVTLYGAQASVLEGQARGKRWSRCPNLGMEVVLKSGEIITSPCCRSLYCERCKWYRKWKLLQRCPHNLGFVSCVKSYLVLPYYSPPSKEAKKRVNHRFWQKLRREYGELAYLHTLEQQAGLVHVNYLVLSDCVIAGDFVSSVWGDCIEAYHGRVVSAEDVYCEPAFSEELTARYILKADERAPVTTYLPPKGTYKKLYYTSPNWDKFVEARSGDKLVEELVNT